MESYGFTIRYGGSRTYSISGCDSEAEALWAAFTVVSKHYRDSGLTGSRRARAVRSEFSKDRIRELDKIALSKLCSTGEDEAADA